MLRTTGWGYRSRWSHIVSFPLALILWPLVEWNFRQRNKGKLPDKHYWADGWMFYWGWCVVPNYRGRNKLYTFGESTVEIDDPTGAFGSK